MEPRVAIEPLFLRHIVAGELELVPPGQLKRNPLAPPGNRALLYRLDSPREPTARQEEADDHRVMEGSHARRGIAFPPCEC